MNKKSIYLKYKIVDKLGNFNVEESIFVDRNLSCKEIEDMLFEKNNKEILLISYSYNCN